MSQISAHPGEAVVDTILPPDPERIVEGLRDTGYTFVTAVADLVDNSISAGASTVDVRLGIDVEGAAHLRVADDGHGMDAASLVDAMRYGSARRRRRDSLGKFGLGLKTASTSFARELTVTSRPRPGRPEARRWDLDEIARRGEWALLAPDPEPEDVELLDEVAPGAPGTVVTWRRIDRVLNGYADPTGRPRMKRLEQMRNELREHLGMVFQRFIDGTAGSRTLTLRVDGGEVSPWDPFQKDVSELVVDEPVTVDMPDGSGRADLTVRAWVLPPHDQWEDDARRDAARIRSDLQGFYVYREGRMIADATWMGMFAKEPHLSLLRVEFDFDHKLDDALHIDVKKNRIHLEDQLWQTIRNEILGPARRAAQQRYRRTRSGIEHGIASGGMHDGSDRAIASRGKDLVGWTADAADERGETSWVTNEHGTGVRRLPNLRSDGNRRVRVIPETLLPDGHLWAPYLTGDEPAVALNTSHDFYRKIHLRFSDDGAVVQALDSLFWALAVTEMEQTHDAEQTLIDYREAASRKLKKLVRDLPEPDTDPGAESGSGADDGSGGAGGGSP